MLAGYLAQLQVQAAQARQRLAEMQAQNADQKEIEKQSLEVQRCEGTYAEAVRDSETTPETRAARLRAIEKRNNDAALAMRMR